MAGSKGTAGALVVDASVWVSAYDPGDAFHGESALFLARLAEDERAVWALELVLAEVACAVARRTGHARAGERAAALLAAYPGLALQPLDGRCLRLAIRLGCRHALRAADAIYLAVARLHGARLITWDREMIARAGACPPG